MFVQTTLLQDKNLNFVRFQLIFKNCNCAGVLHRQPLDLPHLDVLDNQPGIGDVSGKE